MKKYIISLILIFILFLTPNVYAADYKEKELIPVDTETTVRTDNFIYKGIVYSKGNINIEFVRNKSANELPISISVALFDSEKKNIGLINYCDEKIVLGYREKYSEIGINVSNYSRKEGTTLSDIKFIAVWNDNVTCKTRDSLDYVGQKIENMGVVGKEEASTDASILVYVLLGVGGLLFIIFVYNFLFTDRFRDMNGDDTRRAYKKRQEQILDERTNNYVETTETPTEPVIVEEKKDESTALEDLYK